MKRIVLIILFLVCIFNTNAQTQVYHAFPDSNAVWCERWAWFDGTCDNNYDRFIQLVRGDTSIGGHVYHKTFTFNGDFHSSLCGGTGFLNSTSIGIGYRQDIPNKRIYKCCPDTLAYDFNLSLNDTLPGTFNYSSSNDRNYISSIDSVLMDNSYRKEYWISIVGGHSISDSNYVALIEGVGSTFGLFAPLIPNFESYSTLLNFTQSDTIPTYNPCGFMFYTGINETKSENNKITLSPNPFTSQTTLSFGEQQTNTTVLITNLLGEEIKTIPHVHTQQLVIDKGEMKAGIYFVQTIDDAKRICNKKMVVE